MLLVQRPAGKSQAGLWEFPGGKIEPGKTSEEAPGPRMPGGARRLDRGAVRAHARRPPLSRTDPRLILMECRLTPGSALVPQEHQQVAWDLPDQMPAMVLCPADREILESLSV